MSVRIWPAGDYASTLQNGIKHAEIVLTNGTVRDLPDGSFVTLVDFGIIVATPDHQPNSFLPYSSIFEIREADPAALGIAPDAPAPEPEQPVVMLPTDPPQFAAGGVVPAGEVPAEGWAAALAPADPAAAPQPF